jgi:hypothetical protein
VILRSADGDSTPPFLDGSIAALFRGRSLHIANTGIDQPMMAFFDVASRRDYEQRFAEHPAGFREITGTLEVATVSTCSRSNSITLGAAMCWILRPHLPLRLLV